ncbi:helix-turn-helix domain-containing protein [Gemmobacter sp.]|uniref:helix-turn-helix domain-containing protein n=1 Tax=Gemmobacter sp. TaxID=1898957 RepID=UPI002AFF4C71|nr:helix-turn-helix domain-containing protein [Gemmobacter sp.]
MSHKATNWAFQQRGLKPATWRVLVMLADRHNPDNGCFPSQQQLAVDAEMSVSSLNDHLAKLEEIGLIRRVRRINPDTRKQMSTRYIFGFEPDFPQDPTPKIGDGKGPEPSPKNGESRLRNSETNLVREPVITTQRSRAASDAEAECLAACGPGLSESARKQIVSTGHVIEGWLEAGLNIQTDVIPVLRERTATERRSPIRTWDYFTDAIRHAHAQRRRQAERSKIAENSDALSAAVAPNADAQLRRLADWINSGAHVPTSVITNTKRDALLAAGLVTHERLRQLQIY